MERIPVQSSNVAALAYDPAQQLLEVVFKPNRFNVSAVWHYKPVSQETYASFFVEGASVGRILNMVKTLPLIEAYKAREEEPAVSV